MRPMSVTEIAKRLDIDHGAAYNLVRFMCAVGLAQLKGRRKPEHGAGKGENVYSIEVGAGERIAAMVEKRLT